MTYLYGLVVWVVITTTVLAQDGSVTAATTQTPGNPTDTEAQVKQRPIDKAAAPAYTITNFFLEVVIRPPRIADLNENVNLTDPQAILESLQTNWQMWLQHYNGYLVCLIFAGIYVLILLFGGCIICGCRCRGRCGAKQGPMDHKHTKPKRRTCAVLLGFFWILLVLGVTVMFLTNMLSHEQTEKDGLPKVLAESVARFDSFKNLATETYDTYFQMSVLQDVNDLLVSTTDIPKDCQTEVALQTRVGPLIDALRIYIGKLNRTADNLFYIDNLVSTINNEVGDLNADIDALKANFTRDFSACKNSGNRDCENVRNISSHLTINPDFTGVPSMAALAGDFASTLSGNDNVYTGFALALQELDQISETITSVSGATISNLTTQIQLVSKEGENFFEEAVDFMESVSLQSANSFVNETLNPAIMEYGRYWYYGGLALSIFVLLVVFICSIALLFGTCGERAGGVNHCCNKGHSSTMLKVALGLIFLFAWILMIVTAVLVPIGGIVHNDICRNLLHSDDMQSTDIIDDILSHNLNLTFSVYDLFTRCGEEETLFTALKLDERGDQYNLSDILNPNKYGVVEFLNQLKSASFSIGNLTILNNILESNLIELDRTTSSLDLSLHKEQLDKTILSSNLEYLSGILKNASSDNPSLSDQFLYYSSVVSSIQENRYLTLSKSKNSLADIVNSLEEFKNDVNVTVLASKLEQAQILIDSAVLSDAMATTTNRIQDEYERLLSDSEFAIRNELAQCGTVSNVISDSLDGVCVMFLYPFNAFWFSMGWCLFFFIFLIPINLILSDFYRKREPYKNTLTLLDDPFSRERRSSSESGIRADSQSRLQLTAAQIHDNDQSRDYQPTRNESRDERDYRRELGYAYEHDYNDRITPQSPNHGKPAYPSRREEYNNLAYYADYDDEIQTNHRLYGDDWTYRANTDQRTLYPTPGTENTTRSVFRY